MTAIRPIAIAIIRRDNQILVFKDYDQVRDLYYCRPLGGGVEFGELAADALKREFVEELNEEIIGLKQVAHLESIFTLYGKARHELVFVFEAHFANAAVYKQNDLKIIDDPKVEVHWVDIEEFKSKRILLVPEQLVSLI